MKTKANKLNAFLLTIGILISGLSFGQKDGTPPPPKNERRAERQDERHENIETMKIGFITKKLDLTPEEAQKFWPVYNQYSDKIGELRKKRRQDNRDTKQKFDEMSDKEVEAAVDNEMIFRQKELDVQKEYHSKFKSVLPMKKVAKLYAAEEQFKMELLNKLKERDHKQPPPPRD